MTSRAAHRQRRRLVRRMQRDAHRLAAEMQRFADIAEHDGPYSDDILSILKQVNRVALCAARLDGMQEAGEEE